MLTGNAYLVAGNADVIPALLALLEKQGIQTHANPDVYMRTYSQFGVEEARELRERANLRAFASRDLPADLPAEASAQAGALAQAGRAGSRPVSEARRIFIISAPGMTSEAQNALLKTLEEPPANALFFIVVPSPETLLPTLRSRTQRLELSSDILSAETVDIKRFLAATPEKRIDMLRPLLEKDDDEKRDIGAILSFLSSLERALAKNPIRDAVSAERGGLDAIYRARKYVTDKGALVKPLLEHVALLLPRI